MEKKIHKIYLPVCDALNLQGKYKRRFMKTLTTPPRAAATPFAATVLRPSLSLPVADSFCTFSYLPSGISCQHLPNRVYLYVEHGAVFVSPVHVHIKARSSCDDRPCVLDSNEEPNLYSNFEIVDSIKFFRSSRGIFSFDCETTFECSLLSIIRSSDD